MPRGRHFVLGFIPFPFPNLPINTSFNYHSGFKLICLPLRVYFPSKNSRLALHLAVFPNSESNCFEYNLLKKRVEHFDHQMGAGHSLLGNKDVKIMKNCTIILIGCMMTLALKVLAMFTLSMGPLTLKCALLL